MGGQILNRKYVTDNYVIYSAFGQPKLDWANAQPTHPAPTLLLVCTAGVYHSAKGMVYDQAKEHFDEEVIKDPLVFTVVVTMAKALGYILMVIITKYSRRVRVVVLMFGFFFFPWCVLTYHTIGQNTIFAVTLPLLELLFKCCKNFPLILVFLTF